MKRWTSAGLLLESCASGQPWNVVMTLAQSTVIGLLPKYLVRDIEEKDQGQAAFNGLV